MLLLNQITEPSVKRNVSLRFTVNGELTAVYVDPRSSLLDLLRDGLGLVGTKKGCDHGQCGACTVHVNGQRRLSCLQFAAQLDGADVVTIEGVSASTGDLHPLQEAFMRCDALQCGYCTPGQIMSALALLSETEGQTLSEETVREAMSGNICRCGAYNGIVAAILEVANGTE
ncbi:MAG TPA: (2Fe-2S)-binding protein [Marinobacter sp.]|uniref:2Fe-2S ferredoxin-type domain-containing protein n=1 Tax=marine sediment metagenome TaxID=412755 RepID=A0A0F9Q641_9ZZZZ|nr:(2Fe-2S)-binding protein [Marinobacter sp.]